MKLNQIFILALTISMVFACSKDEEAEKTNPFNHPSLQPPIDTSVADTLPYGSFQYLYHHVFKPTCANSGCHDGNFPPEFRTIYSAYNTLVNQPVIQNDPQGSFKYRVEPFNVEKSLLHTRLTVFMPNTSGQMPLAVDSGSDYNERKDEYIQMIVDWIKNGAPDTYGNIPTEANPKPNVIGMLVFNSGNTTTPLLRLNNKSTNPVIIPKSPIDVWFALLDDTTVPSNFKLSKVKSSRELFNFIDASEKNLKNSTPISGNDFWGNAVSFTHKVTFNFQADTNNTYIFLRTYLHDEDQTDTTEIPNLGTNEILRSYFTLKVDTL